MTKKRRMQHQVTTFVSGWWYHDTKGWGQHEDGPMGSHRSDIRSKRRAVEEAKKLACLCGEGVAVIWTYKNGKRLCQEFTFTAPGHSEE